MRPGSVIVDMAAANGGNVEGTVKGEVGRHRQRRDDHRLHRPARPAAGAGVPAVRHQPGQPDEAAHARQGRAAGARPGRRRAARRSPSPATARSCGHHRRCRYRRRTPPNEAQAAAGQGREAADVDGARASRSSGIGVAVLFLLTAFAPTQLITQLHRVRPRGGDRLLRHRQGAPRAAHAVDVDHECDLRDHRGRRAVADRQRRHGRSGCCRSSRSCSTSINIFGGFAVTRRMLGMFNDEAP